MNKELQKDMMPKLIGDTYMRKAYPNKRISQRYTYGIYECQYCGNSFELMVKQLPKIKSCGCLKLKPYPILAYNIYKNWRRLVQSCINPKNKGFKYNGAKGVGICSDWLNFDNYMTWVNETHPHNNNAKLSKLDKTKDFAPENCIWTIQIVEKENL